MKNTPVDYQTARRIIDGFGLPDFGKATIREVVAISTQLEQETGTEFIHMEMGVPGLKAAQVGVDAEIEALRNGIASIYPNINGTPEVKVSFPLYQGVYKYRYRPRVLRTRNRFHAGHIRLFPYGRIMYAGKRHHLVYRPRIPRAETANSRYGL